MTDAAKQERVFVRELWDADIEKMRKLYPIPSMTDALVQLGAEHGVYRQCSIGWHDECSQREDRSDDNPCMCKCHVDPFYGITTVGRVSVAESVYRVRVEQGEVMLGWLAPGWIENQDERWIKVEPGVIPAIWALLDQAAKTLPQPGPTTGADND